jgi:hypothetical protein
MKPHPPFAAFGLALVFLILSVGSFKTNLFYIAPAGQFPTFERSGQSLVVAKLDEITQGKGVFEGGFLRGNGPFYHGRVEECDTDLNIRYNSQLGLQGLAFASAHHLLGWETKRTIVWIEWVVAASMALAAVFFLFVLGSRYGCTAVLLPGALIFFSVDILLFAKNAYWVSFTFFLPYITALWLYPKMLAEKMRPAVFGLALGGTVFLKASCGYEFITNILLSACPLILCLGLADGRSWKKLLSDQLCWGSFSLAGFLAAMLCHFIFLSTSLGNWESAVNAVASRANAHTLEPVNGVMGQPVLLKYLQPGVGTLLALFKFPFHMAVNFGAFPPLGGGDYFILRGSYWGLVFLAFVVITVAWLLARSIYLGQPEGRLLWGIVFSLPASWIFSMSWLIAAKFHAVLHMYLISITFCFPFLFHLCFSLAVVVSLVLRPLQGALSVRSR